MTDDAGSGQRDPAQDVSFDLDDVGEYVPTGDPLVDRGAKLTLREMIEAEADPQHPDHEAAIAWGKRVAEQYQGAIGGQLRRISENLAAAAKPNLGSLFATPRTTSRHSRVAVPEVLTPDAAAEHGALDVGIDDTPRLTLDALLTVSERMSEMVRVSAEQRDVAISQMTHFKQEAVQAHKAERRMFWITLAALVGTWVAVGVAFAAL